MHICIVNIYEGFGILKRRTMMDFFFNTIQEFNDFIGVKTLHPMVSIARVENTTPIQEAMHHYDIYAIFTVEYYCFFPREPRIIVKNDYNIANN